jgi:hypothetical protein
MNGPSTSRVRFFNRDNRLYQYVRGRVFTPGAANFGFLPPTTTPPILSQGAGKRCGLLAVFQPPQVFAPQLLTPIGPGGIPTNAFDFLSGLRNPQLLPDINNTATWPGAELSAGVQPIELG